MSQAVFYRQRTLNTRDVVLRELANFTGYSEKEVACLLPSGIEGTVNEYYEPRTLKQNALWHAIKREIANADRKPEDEIEKKLKALFLPEYAEGTRVLSKNEMEWFLDRCMAWAAKEHGLEFR